MNNVRQKWDKVDFVENLEGVENAENAENGENLKFWTWELSNIVPVFFGAVENAENTYVVK